MSQVAQTTPEQAQKRALSSVPGSGKSKSVMNYPAWARFMKKLIAKSDNQGALAKDLGVSQAQVSRWARGLGRPATLELAVELTAKVGGDVQAAQTAWNADPAAPRGRKASKRAAKKTAAKKTSATKAAPAARAAAPTPPPTGLDGIKRAQRALSSAERQLDEAVVAARATGASWPEIAQALQG